MMQERSTIRMDGAFCYLFFSFLSRIIAMMQEVPLKREPNTAVEPMIV